MQQDSKSKFKVKREKVKRKKVNRKKAKMRIVTWKRARKKET